MPDPFDPSHPIVMAANADLQDAAFRDRVRALHAADTPLVKMTRELGLDLNPDIKTILEGLKPDVVDGIRAATLQMLDSTDFTLPLDCLVTPQDTAKPKQINVSVDTVDLKQTIHVRKKKK